ncbi:MAG: integrase [Pseudomonadota bacterium]|nr:integrase [Pseudomonadota bacterium]
MSPAIAQNTLRAYAADWAAFARWCRVSGVSALPPAPDLVARYLAEIRSGTDNQPPLSAASVERRLAGLIWSFDQRGAPLDRHHPALRALRTELRANDREPARKHPIRAEDIRAMIATLPYDLRGLRDRAILLLGFAGGLGPSDLVSLDFGGGSAPDRGRLTVTPEGACLTFSTPRGWSQFAVGRGTTNHTCPVHAVSQWVSFAGIARGPLFVRISRDGTRPLDDRLSARHVARFVKRTAQDAGLRPDLPPTERQAIFSGQSLRTGLAASLGLDNITALRRHISPPDTADRPADFSLNLTRAAGL